MAEMLLVDDSGDIRDLLELILQLAGHKVRVACNGREGLEKVTERTPDLILLDVEMPILSGPEIASTLFLRNQGDEKIPIILLSGVVGLSTVAADVGTPY